MNPVLRIILNFVIVALSVLLIAELKWINFEKPPTILTDPTLNKLLIAGVIGTFMLVIGEVLEFIWGVIKFATLGAAKFFYPIYFIIAGYLKLIIPALILVNWYKYTTVFWQVLVISLMIGLIRIPANQKKE